MRVGDTVRVKACQTVPELVGCEGRVVDLQAQSCLEPGGYTAWVKMVTGRSKGRVYSFREDEIELVAPDKTAGRNASRPVDTHPEIKSRVIEQIEQLLSGVVSPDELAEIEKRLNEARGRLPAEPGKGFWENKTPCWEMFRCPESIRNDCPAYRYTAVPCWEIEGTYSKLYDYGEKGDKLDICRHCRVYKKYGNGKPIRLILDGIGLNRKGKF